MKVINKVAESFLRNSKHSLERKFKVDFAHKSGYYREYIKTVSKENYHIASEADFIDINGDWSYILKLGDYFISESGSEYVTTDKGVYRRSDHWFNVASCYWTINNQKEINIGYCEFSDFRICTDNTRDYLYCAANPEFVKNFPKYRKAYIKALKEYLSENEMTEAVTRMITDKVAELEGKSDYEYLQYLQLKNMYLKSKKLY